MVRSPLARATHVLSALVLAFVACGADDSPPVVPLDAAELDARLDPCPSVLTSTCDPLAAWGQQGCNPGQKCTWIVLRDAPGDRWGVIGCVPDGLQPPGEACVVGPPGATTGFDDCTAGNQCVGGVCRDVCGFGGGASEACAAGLECREVDGVWSNCGVTPPYGTCGPVAPP